MGGDIASQYFSIFLADSPPSTIPNHQGLIPHHYHQASSRSLSGDGLVGHDSKAHDRLVPSYQMYILIKFQLYTILFGIRPIFSLKRLAY